MRSYFTQFGTVLHLRLSRSKKTGNSKHYGFIEFASRDVAKIVAETMDKYLMFGQILKCKLLNKEEVHPDLWIGADKRFKTVPWAKIEGRKLEMGMGREKWSRRIEGERKRRSAKMEKLKGIGYEFEAPELKGVDTVAVREKKVAEAIEPAGAEKTIVSSAGDGTVVVSEELPTSKKAPRGKKTAGKKDADAGVEVAAILTEATDAVKAGADALAAVEPATKANIKKRRAPDVPAAVAEEKLPKKSKNAVGVKDGSEDRIEESAAAPAEAAEGKKVAKKGKRKST
jgi:nucleolar protein 15